MPLQLNNQNHGYYDQLWILNEATGLWERVRDLITNAGQSGGTVTSANAPLSISNGALSIDLSTYSLSSALTQALLLGVGNVIHTHDFQSNTLTIAGGGNSKTLSLNMQS